eukprot:5085705-Pyramimonas_sp.AAC.1
MDFPVGDTFFGHRGSSSIDHVAVFQWQRSLILDCRGLRRSNLRLKLIAKRGLQDHIPILLSTSHSFDMSWSRPEGA